MSRISFKTKLSNIAFVSQGQSPESKYYSSFDGTPFLQGNRTFGVLYPSFDTYTRKVTRLAKKGDVLMSVRAPVGSLNFAPCDLCIGRGLASLRAKNGSNKFVYYALKYNVENLIKQGPATTFDSVNKDIINNFEIIIPEKESEREKIASVLSTLDSKIELNNRINAEIEAMAKTIYDYWFVQFDFPSSLASINSDSDRTLSKVEGYKTSGGEMVYNQELKRQIPKGWEVENLKSNSLTDLIKPRIDIFDGEKTYLATADVSNKEINYGADKITFKNRESRANMQPVKNSIWFAKMKNTKKVLYLGEYSDYFIESFILSTGFAGVKCKEKFSLEYMWGVINSDSFEKIKDRLSNGATQEAINNDSMAFIPLIIPSEDILKAYHKKTFEIYKKIYLNQIENQKLAELRDFLLPMLMNGQIVVE